MEYITDIVLKKNNDKSQVFILEELIKSSICMMEVIGTKSSENKKDDKINRIKQNF